MFDYFDIESMAVDVPMSRLGEEIDMTSLDTVRRMIVLEEMACNVMENEILNKFLVNFENSSPL